MRWHEHDVEARGRLLVVNSNGGSGKAGPTLSGIAALPTRVADYADHEQRQGEQVATAHHPLFLASRARLIVYDMEKAGDL